MYNNYFPIINILYPYEIISDVYLTFFFCPAVRYRLAELSKASKCLLNALPVQLPFHLYEEEVYKLVEPMMPQLINTFVERRESNAKGGVTLVIEDNN